ncbi:MAG: PilW family protein [Thiohalobacterales bacterium]
MMQRRTQLQRQRGISLVELMVGLTIGLLLLGGLLQLFTSSKSTYTTLTGISRVQEGGRISIERMKYNLRMAGNIGCSNLNALTPNNVSGNAFFNNITAVQGSNDLSGGTPGVNPVDGTDTLTVTYARPSDTELSGDMTSATADIPINGNPDNLAANAYLLVTDCENADFLLASGISASLIAHSSALSKPYLDNSLVASMQSITYSVRDTGRTDRHGNPVLSLFETPLSGAAVEIVNGVEDMQVTYGEDSTGDGAVDAYRDADTVSNWNNVLSVRVQLLVATDEDIGSAKRPYTDLKGTAVPNPGDFKIRRRFSSTVNLRNRSS